MCERWLLSCSLFTLETCVSNIMLQELKHFLPAWQMTQLIGSNECKSGCLSSAIFRLRTKIYDGAQVEANALQTESPEFQHLCVWV